MKRFIKIIGFSIFTALIGSSCDKDFLSPNDGSVMTEQNVFINIDFAEKAVLNIYNHYSNSTTYLYNLSCSFWVDTDIAYSRSTSELFSPAHYTNDDSNTLLSSQWTNLYKAIEAANIVIDGLPKSGLWDGPDSKKAKYLYGEAVALRAFSYKHLIFIWGDVPFFTSPTQGDSDFFPPKTDRDEIYEYLIQDLKDVEEYVMWMDETQTIERVSKGFVKGLRAKLALQYAGYSLRAKTFETRRGRYWEEYLKIAHQECLELMKSNRHRLNPSFERIFRDLHSKKEDMTYKEWIYCMPSLRGIGEGRFGSQNGGMATAVGKYAGTATDNGYFKTTPAYFYSFDKDDIRRGIAVAPYTHQGKNGIQILHNQTALMWGLTKWRVPWIEPTMAGQSTVFTGIDIPVMRYSDIVLMFAEIENELHGPSESAKEALASIRKRAFPEGLWPDKVINYIDSIAASKESFFNAIVDERAWEFGGEFIRKEDLIRWNLYGAKVKEWKQDMSDMINDHPRFSHIPDYVFWKYKDDGETVEFFNLDKRIHDLSIPGYNRAPWHMALNDPTWKSNWLDIYIPLVAKGYDETKNNHLYPISRNHIAASRGAWSNDQIP